MITSVKKQGYDIIVVGGGIAGCCAALAAARENKSVLLVEKHINLGGLATIGLISWFEPLCDGEGRKMMGGMAEEMIRLAVGCGYDNLPEIWAHSLHALKQRLKSIVGAYLRAPCAPARNEHERSLKAD